MNNTATNTKQTTFNNTIIFPGVIIKQNKPKTSHPNNLYGDPTSKAADPITNQKDINTIIEYFYNQKPNKNYTNIRNATIFICSCNFGLRVSDFCRLRIKDLFMPNSTLENPIFKYSVDIREKKTQKIRRFPINQASKNAIMKYLTCFETFPSAEKYLFQSAKGNNNHLTEDTITHIWKEIQRDCNFDNTYNLGSHSGRKTFAYWLYVQNGKSDEVLHGISEILNHSSTNITKRYLGITSESNNELIMDLNIEYQETSK